MANILEQSQGLKKLWSGYQSTRVLFTANNYRVFDFLQKQKTVRSLAKEIGADVRATGILLDALTGLGLLIKQNNKYRNSSEASRFLVSGSPHYQGDIIKHGETMWDRWSDLDRVMKTGRPSQRSRDHNAFILGMHNISSLKAKEIINGVGMKGIEKALDLGGGPGTYSLEMARRGAKVTLFDLPETIKIAKKLLARSPIAAKNMTFIKGDFFVNDIGKGYDLIFISQIVHSLSEKESISLLRKCRRALNDKGRVVIHEFPINEQRTDPVRSALFAVNMLVNSEGGRTWSPGDMKNWFKKAGFKSARKKEVVEGVLVSANK
ncbi:MAG: methyltransferase domain-containing protein [Nitrospira sp.]|nr:methyltransferase domain-containing protein [Nitrospira sp.]